MRNSINHVGLVLARGLSLIALLLIPLLGASRYAIASDSIQLLYENRAPFTFKDKDGKLIGIVVQAIEPAFQRAGIRFTWVETPFKRQLNVIEQNLGNNCAVAVFMTPERKRYAKFSAAILHDQEKSSIILAHQDFKIPAGLDLRRVLSLPSARLLKKEQASYGPNIDEAIERSQVQIIPTTAESRNMAKMILAKRADFIFVSEEEALLLIKETTNGAQLQIYTPTGMPQGQDRYLMCSRRVSDSTLHRFNQALTP